VSDEYLETAENAERLRELRRQAEALLAELDPDHAAQLRAASDTGDSRALARTLAELVKERPHDHTHV
jgi:hypothetical protein